MQRGLVGKAPRHLLANSSGIRTLNARRLATEATPSPSATGGTTIKPKKKRKLFRKTLLYSTGLVTTVYGAGLAAAVNDERAHDFFVERVPLGEQLVDFAESQGYVGGLPRAAVDPNFTPRRQRPTPSSSSAQRVEPPASHEKAEALRARVEGHVREKKERIRDVASQLHMKKEKGASRGITPANIQRGTPAPLPPNHYSEGSGELVQEVEAVLKGSPKGPIKQLVDTVLSVTPSLGTTHPAVPSPSTPGNPEPSKVDTDEIVPPQGKQWYDGPKLPLEFEPPPGYALRPPKKVPKTTAGLLLVAPAVEEFTASEPMLKELANTVDNLAKYLEENPKAEKGVNKVLEAAKQELSELGTKITTTQESAKKELETKLDEQAKSYSVKLLEAELEARDKLDAQDDEWKKYFDQERLSLLQKYQEKLDNELETQKELINERLKEEVIAQGIELQRRWVRDVQLHVEEERGGRLAKLEEVATGLKKLERLTLDNANYLDENLRLHAVWSALRALTNVSIDAPARTPFRDELHVLKSVASAAGAADDLVVAAIESLEKSDVADIGVEPLSDLTAWFVTSVAPRTSAVALVPEYGGGVLLHLASSLLSSMRFKRSGLVEGNDVLSVLARAEYYLHEKDLDSATRELNQLQGPPKELLRDWLAAARRRLAVQQALQVVQAQATLSSLLVL